ncbi:HAD hydrolase family protein, partial [Treponema endosymbiont of Eucomonympha sp.]|uniref:RraA family protein n=1 Tax=Treponema endosymbiont of Eucomonympha sp. TaxID=1580831 RepID=UPI001EE77E29
MLKEMNLRYENVLYIGDDINDYEAMKKCKLRCCPSNAVTEIKEIADVVLQTAGGNGCLREVTDIILGNTNMKDEKSFVSNLCSGTFSDIMDSLGYKNQIITNYRHNWHGLPIGFMGRARTVLIETYETDDENILMGLGFLSQVGKGEVLVVKGSQKFAYFGELMTRLSIRQRIEGIIIDGLTRDTKFTHNQCPLSIIAKGYSPVDIKGRGRVQAVDVDILVDGVEIHKDDLIFADNDAICVI